NESRGYASPFWGYALDRVNLRFDVGRVSYEVHGDPPLDRRQFLKRTWAYDAPVLRSFILKTLAPLDSVGFLMRPDPLGIIVIRSRFAEELEEALGRTLDVGFKEPGGDDHRESPFSQ